MGKKRSDYDDFRVSEESNGFPDGSLKHWPEAVGDGGWVSKKSTSADIASPGVGNLGDPAGAPTSA